MIERNITVPLKKARRGSSRRYAPKAIDYLRKFVARHMKAKEVVVGGKLNELIWERGITNPPRKVEVKAVKKTKDDLVVFVEVASISKEAMDKFVRRGEPVEKSKKAGKAEKARPEPKKDEEKAEKKAEPAKKAPPKKVVKKTETKKVVKKPETKKVVKKTETKKAVKKTETKKAAAKKKPATKKTKTATTKKKSKA
jgi:large subunit ribosomal protein L31e